MSSEKENSKSVDMKEDEKDTKDESTVDSKEDTDDKSAEESEEKEPPKRKSVKVKETKKVVKSEDEDDEDDEDEEEEDDEDDEDEKGDGKVPLLDQPLELSGTRERKKVQRFTEEFKAEPKDVIAIEIPEGKGTALGAIPRIEASIQKFRPDVLKPLHRVLFGRVGKTTTLKKNLRKFNGFDFEKDSDHFEKKKHMMQKLEMRLLRLLCSILDVEKKGNREEIAEKLMGFLLEPKDSGKPPPTPRPKRTAAKANNKNYSSDDDDDDDDDKPALNRSRRGKGKLSTLKDPSSSEDEEEEDKESGAEDESFSDDDAGKSKKRKSRSKGSKANAKKSSAKKGSLKKTPSKPAEKKSAPKKRKSPAKSEDDSSSEDEPLAKKAKSPPSDEEIKTYVKEILEGANLEEITMKTVCKQVYAHYPDFDLAHKKDLIKTTVKSLISS